MDRALGDEHVEPAAAGPERAGPTGTGTAGMVRVATGPFPRHFGARLVAERRRSHRPLWIFATRSRGEFTLRDLRDAEAGLLPLEAETVVKLADVYGLEIRAALPPMRRGLEIGEGSMHAAGVTVDFRPDDARSMVDAYFRLVRTLRSIDDESPHDRPPIEHRIEARHDDLEEMVRHLRRSTARSSTTAASTRYLESVLTMACAEHRVVVGGLVAGAAAIDLAGVTEHSIPAVIDVADAAYEAAHPRP